MLVVNYLGMEDSMKKSKIERLNSEEVAYLCNQMNVILDAGVPLQEGLEVLLEDIQNKGARQIIQCILDGIENKKLLHITLKECGVFPKYMINMVRIGEMTGKLDEVFGQLAEYYSNENEMKQEKTPDVLNHALLMKKLLNASDEQLERVLEIISPQNTEWCVGLDISSLSIDILQQLYGILMPN